MDLALYTKTVYGNVYYYPLCDTSQAAIELVGKKTLDKADLILLQRMGFTIKLQADPAACSLA